jgi:hypothetical protein
MRLKKLPAIGLFVIALAAVAAFGQAPFRAQIDFPFTVNGKALPAGIYSFIRDASVGVFRVADGKNEAIAPILTRIASVMPSVSAVVFDKVGDSYVLAEVWIPGEDGYVIAVTKASHEHKVVKVK